MIELLPIVKAKLKEHEEICKAHNLFFVVTSTYRSSEDQDKLYAQGRTTPGAIVTNAKAGQSFHNWKCAYDVWPQIDGKMLSFSDPRAESLLTSIGFYGQMIGLKWGGDFGDKPHFEYTRGYTWQDFIDKKVDLTKFDVPSTPEVQTPQTPVNTPLEALLAAIKTYQLANGINDFKNAKPYQVLIGKKTLSKYCQDKGIDYQTFVRNLV